MNFDGYITWRGRQVMVRKKAGPGFYNLTVAIGGDDLPLPDKDWEDLRNSVKRFLGE